MGNEPWPHSGKCGSSLETWAVLLLPLPGLYVVRCGAPGLEVARDNPLTVLPTHRRLRPVKEMAQSHEYLSIEYSEEEVWLTWTDRNNEHHEKSVRQLAQEARAGNAHDENVLSYYRCPPPPPRSSAASCS